MGTEAPCRRAAELPACPVRSPVPSPSAQNRPCWAEPCRCSPLSLHSGGGCSSCAVNGAGAGAASVPSPVRHVLFRRGAGDGITSAWWSLVTLCRHSLPGWLHLERIPLGNVCIVHGQQSHTSRREPHRQIPELHHELHQCLAMFQFSPGECPTPWHFAAWNVGEDLCTQIHRSCSYRHSSDSLTLCHARTLPFSQKTSHQLPVVMLFTFFLFEAQSGKLNCLTCGLKSSRLFLKDTKA